MVGWMQPKTQREKAIPSESAYIIDREHTEGRSCLSVRFPRKNRSGSSNGSAKLGRQIYRSNTSVRSSISSVDQSDDTHALLSNQPSRHVWNHSTTRQSPKHRQNNESPTSTMNLPSVHVDSPHHPAQNSVKSLLTPPRPVNRSPQIQNRRPRVGLYDGEVEPEGVRGQEAVVAQKPLLPPRGPEALLMRTTFESNAPLSSLQSTGMYGYPLASRNMEDSSNDSSILSRSTIDKPSHSTLPSVHEGAPMQFSPETGQAVRLTGSRANVRLSRTSGSQRRPIHRRISDAESTASEDNIRRMMPDFMSDIADEVTSVRHWQTPTDTLAHQILPSSRPLPSNTLTVGVQGANLSQAPVVSPESPGLSRAAQTAAAAAAAVVHRQSNTQPSRSVESSEENDNQKDLDHINAIAMEHVHNGDYERALAVFMQVLNIQRRTNGDVHPAVASAYHNLGTVHAKRAALLVEDSRPQRQCRSQALECFQSAARVARDSLGKNHPNVAVSLVRIGFLLLQSRQYDNAVVTFQEALRIRLAYYGPEHGLVANLYNNLGVCHMHLQDFEKGKERLEQALVIQRRVVHENEDDLLMHQLELADTLFNIGGLCLEWIRREGPHSGRAKDAVVAFQETLNIRLKILGQNDPSVMQVRLLLEMAHSVSSPTPPSEAMGYKSQEEFESPNTGERRTQGHDINRAPLSANYVDGRYADTAAAVLRGSRNQECFERNSDYPGAKFQNASNSKNDPEHGDERYSDNNTRHQRNENRWRRSHITSHNVSELQSGEIEADRDFSRHGRMRIEPLFVPEPSPVKEHRYNGNSDAIREPLSDEELFSLDKSFDTLEKFGYDDKNSLIRKDTDVNSARGRIHHHRTLQNADKAYQHHVFSKSSDHGPDQETNLDLPLHFPPNRADEDINFDETIQFNAIDRRSSLDRNSTVSTGNVDRDDVMSRTRAILLAHPYTKKSQHPQPDHNRTSRELLLPQLDSRGLGASVEESHEDGRQGIFDQVLMEDGVAPLGGYWPSRATESKDLIPMKHMLADPTNYLSAIHDEASSLLKNNHVLDAWKLFDVVLVCQRNKHGPLHPDVASALHNVGISQLRADSHSDALKSFEEAARIRKGSLGSEHPLLAVSMVKVGICLLLIHRFDQALWSFREALTIRKRALGPLHPSTARIYNNIGCVHVDFNEFNEARQAFEAALHVQRNALTHDPASDSLMFGTATTLCNLGYLYRHRNLHAKACLVLKEAADLQETVLGKLNANVLSTLDNLADSYANSGNKAEALETYKMILARFLAGGPSDRKKLARAEAVLLYKMSRVYRHQNDRESQLNCLEVAHQTLFTIDKDGTGDSLDRRIQLDIRSCRESFDRKW